MASLVECGLNAPLVAVLEAEPRTFHAVTMEAVVKGWEFTDDGKVKDDLHFDAACGVAGVKLVGSGNEPVPWPPFAPKRPLVRCLDCHKATGRKSPRSRFNVTEAS